MTIRHELLPPPLVEQHARGWAVVAGQLQAQLVAAAALPRAAGQYPLLVWPSGQAEARLGSADSMIDTLIERMQALLEPLEAVGDPKRIFHATYLRTTIAVAAEIRRPGGFTDPDWTERWDIAFADLYLEALQQAQAGEQPSSPGQSRSARRPGSRS